MHAGSKKFGRVLDTNDNKNNDDNDDDNDNNDNDMGLISEFTSCKSQCEYSLVIFTSLINNRLVILIDGYHLVFHVPFMFILTVNSTTLP